jgi:aldehyde:ferredoxin oxidoreductase
MIRPERVGAPGSQFGDPSYQFAAKRFTAATGIPMDEKNLLQIGERICNLERAIVVRDGRTRATDVLPEFFFKTPVPDGPQVGKKLDKAMFEKMKDEYYNLRGWDVETGLQKESTLKALNMSDIALDLKKMKKLVPKKKSKGEKS